MKYSEEIVIGKVLGPKGIKGEVKVLPLTYSIERFHEVKGVSIIIRGEKRRLNIEYVKPYKKNLILIKFSEISDRTTAERLRGVELKIPIEESPPPPEGSYYYYQIIGIEVVTDEGRVIGKVEEIWETGANDIYIVRDREKEYLIPAVEEFIREIDIDQNRMTITPVEGLLEIYEK
jgi:16S rRNA processing protein RimM